MDGAKLQEKKLGSVKAAISSYGQQILEANPAKKKFQENYPEKSHTQSREFHQEKWEAEPKLSAAKKTVKDLTLKIEESNARARREMEKLKMAKRWENSESEKMMRELESVKRELSKLKQDMVSILEEKRRADKETDSSMSKILSYSSSIEALTKEIEEINEEHVLVELARIEANKEYRDIEAQRRQQDEKYSAFMEECCKKKQEIEDAKEVETKLAITISDIKKLESELKQIKEMEEDELEATKIELTSIKEESFEFMASMDVFRDELKHVMEEKDRFKKKENKADATIQNLNLELLRSKAKLEETSTDSDKAKTIVSSLSDKLEKIKSETETAKKEQSLISEKTALVNAELKKTETEINLADERLQAAMEDLQAIKSSEAIALENLKALIQNTIRNRASASQSITISKFEYEYLKGRAAGASEIADKKVAAAEAWIEALKTSEKENLIKTDFSQRETRDIRVEKQREIPKMENENLQPDQYDAYLSKAMNRRDKSGARRVTVRRYGSPVVHGSPRSTSFTVRRRTKMMPNLAKFLSGRSTERNLWHAQEVD